MSQSIICGENSLKNLEEILLESKVKRFLLVHDSSFQFLSAKDYFANLNIDFVSFSDFTPNPLYEDVCKGVDVYLANQCDAIVAIGGGSAIDVAKCIKLYAKMDKNVNYLEQEYKDTGILLIAIPTTAGTGSESTRFAVIYYDGKKQSVAHESIVPNVAILEPSVLKTLPLYQKKCTVLDALCQGIESYWSVNSTAESKEYSEKAISLIMKYKDEYLNCNTEDSAQKIMLGANYSGRAINITQTTAAHAMSYKITSLYKIPHGHAVAICLPRVWEFMLKNIDKCLDKRGSEYLGNIFLQIANLLGSNSAKEAISNFIVMLEEMGMGYPNSDNKEEDLAVLAASVNPVRLKNNPILPNEVEVREMYNSIIF